MKPTPLSFFSHLLSQNRQSNPLISGVAIDSRNVKRGDLFFALPGNKVDGHDFLQDVAAKGGIAAVVHESYSKNCFGLSLLRVPHVLQALQELGRKVLQSRSCKVVGISGSVGKTTTKEFAKTLLETKYKVAASYASYNTDSTLPLTILEATGEEQVLVLEMGMCRPGEIATLISIAPPDIALLTTVAIQHASHFPNGLQGISQEKATLFSHPKTSLGILHREIPHFEDVVKTGVCPKMTFSLVEKNADYFLEFLSAAQVSITHGRETAILPFTLPAKVFAHNLLAACIIARSLDVPWSNIAEAVWDLKLPSMRFERVEKQGILFINDAYNANPDSMKAALENLPPPPSTTGKRIAVLGEMNALGQYSDAGHTLIAKTAMPCVDLLLCIGSRAKIMVDIWEQEKKEVYFFEEKEALIEALKKIAQKGDVVLLKGARSYCLDKILDHF